MNGIVIMDKPAGVTSFKALGIIKKAYCTKRVGHTGTLDPDATGVLPVLIGKATRAAELVTASDKEYIARVRLGVKTDTDDLSGQILAQAPVDVSESELLKAAESFVGEIEQIPPMYSAVSVGGQRLYDLARKGIEAERAPRRVTIHSIEITDIALPEFSMRVSCSKGTYIRTLAADIASKLNTFGALCALRRTRCGVFSLQDAHSPDEIAANPAAYLRSTDSLFSDFPSINLDERMSRLVKNGVPAYFDGNEGETLRVYDNNADFIALSKVCEIDSRLCLKSIKTFY